MRVLKYLLLLMFLSLPLCASTYDNSTLGHCDATVAPNVCTTGVNGPATVLTIAHVTGTNTNRAMEIPICVAASSGTVVPVITSVVHATSQNLSAVPSSKKFDSTGTNYYCELWALPAGTQPTSGTNNVVITVASTLPSNGWINAMVITASDVDQTTTLSISPGGNNGAGTATSLTLAASGASDLVFSVSCGGSDFTGTNQTTRGAQSGGGAGACGSMQASTAVGGTTSLGDTLASDSWIKIGAAFKDVGGGGGGGTKHRLTTTGAGM